MAAPGYWQAKCATCGHARGKHTMRGGDGCTVRTGARRRLASGRMVTRIRDCECRVFREKGE